MYMLWPRTGSQQRGGTRAEEEPTVTTSVWEFYFWATHRLKSHQVQQLQQLSRNIMAPDSRIAGCPVGYRSPLRDGQAFQQRRPQVILFRFCRRVLRILNRSPAELNETQTHPWGWGWFAKLSVVEQRCSVTN